jgi:hypothetical protein
MYLGSKIWRRLNKHSEKLIGQLTHKQFLDEVQTLLKPFGAKVELKHHDLKTKRFCIVGGEFTPGVVRTPITIFLHVNSNKSNIYMSRKKIRSFLFTLSQTLQHELVHKYQFQRSGNQRFYTHSYYYTMGSAKGGGQSMEYLAMVEEVDAYAHDLAMEIKYHYPDIDPKEVLKNLNNYDNLTTWYIYKRVFRKARWKYVRNELLKKTYKWLPYVQEKFI